MGTNSLLTGNSAVVFFDANCLLCSRFVSILLKYDKQQLYYSGFDSDLAREFLPESLRNNPETIVFAERGKLYFKSHAVFKISGYLRQPWPLVQMFRLIPEKWLDKLYDWIAKNRVHWFGRSEACYMPTLTHKNRVFT